MSDQEIIRVLAEKVMGFDTSVAYTVWYEPSGRGVENIAWNPLMDDVAACAVLDRMGVDQGLDVHLNRTYGLWTCNVHHRAPGMAPPSMDHSAGRRRAICLAALRAVGVEVEG